MISKPGSPRQQSNEPNMRFSKERKMKLKIKASSKPSANISKTTQKVHNTVGSVRNKGVVQMYSEVRHSSLFEDPNDRPFAQYADQRAESMGQLDNNFEDVDINLYRGNSGTLDNYQGGGTSI